MSSVSGRYPTGAQYSTSWMLRAPLANVTVVVGRRRSIRSRAEVAGGGEGNWAETTTDVLASSSISRVRCILWLGRNRLCGGRYGCGAGARWTQSFERDSNRADE